MTINKKYSLQQKGLQHKVAPREIAWTKLDHKLETRRANRRSSHQKLGLIAAVMMCILAFLFVVSNRLETAAIPDHSNEKYSMSIVDMKMESDHGIYEYNKLQELKLAYQKIGTRKYETI